MNRKQIAIDFANSLDYPEIKKIILYGSVDRGEDNGDSDIDILIITNKKSDKNLNWEDVYDNVVDVLVKTGEHISIKFKSNDYYNKYKNFSFFSNVEKEGIVI